MDKKTILFLVAGILVTILLYFVSIYLAGIAAIVIVAIIMSMMIMQDSGFHPLVDVNLREDAKAILLTNSGNSPAIGIHVSLVPLNIEYDIALLAVDKPHEFPLESMIKEVKVVITYANEKGQQFSRSEILSASRERFDPLKPMIPIFGWK